MFKRVKKIKEKIKKIKYIIKFSELKEGINLYQDFFILLNNSKIKIYDRKCDHAGGKLISKNNKIVCPIHNWEFCTRKKKYTNGFEKKEIEYKKSNNNLIFFINEYIPDITRYKSKEFTKFKIKFINHACLIFENKNFKFATDPWCFGPAFNNGWWLKYKTRKNWLEEIESCDFIYISHNHPDHLHAQTLKKINKNKKIIIPKFNSDSTGLLLEDLGFKNIERFEFGYEYRMINNQLNISILKSGDFREDSGLYFSFGEFTALLDVDSNNINFSQFPNVTLYGSSFAGGASGYPLMFENFSDKEKKRIIELNKNFTKSIKLKNINKIKPKYFLPYAGFFSEKMERDKKIKKMNKKNNIENYYEFCERLNIKILNVEKKDCFEFNNSRLIKEKKEIKLFFKDINKNSYLKNFKKEFNSLNINYLKNYFYNSNFKDNLLLFLELTDDNFKSIKKTFLIDFSKPKVEFKVFSNLNFEKMYNNLITKKKKLYIKVRKESFLATIYKKQPWEDLLIGFQCKILRQPNIYNAKFWFHFTNKYISEKRVKAKIECNNCDSIMQTVDNDIYNSKSF